MKRFSKFKNLCTSPLRDGGLGIIIEPWVGVGVCLDCFGGKAGWISPTSENKSPRSIKKKKSF